MPGDPVDIMISSNPHIRPEDISRLREIYGLDQPIYTRYLGWLGSILKGDLGYSRTYKIPVVELLGPRMLNTLILSALAFVAAVVVGIAIGIIAGLKTGSKFDYIVNFFAFAGVAMPSFFIAILLILFFAVKLHWFPAGGTMSIGEDLGFTAQIGDRLKYLALPFASLTILQMASYTRYARSSMIDAIRSGLFSSAACGIVKTAQVPEPPERTRSIPGVTGE